MKLLKSNTLAACLILAAISVSSFAQGPLYKKVNYTIDAPFALQHGDRVLPAGKYVLFQLSLNNPNLFALYQGDMTHSPVALLHTVRIDFQSGNYPEETRILFNKDEEQLSRGMIPVIKGWTIPGMDGWEVLSVVTDHKQIMAEMAAMR